MSSLWWLGTAVQAAREDGIGAYETIGHEKAAIATGTQQNSSPRPKDEGHDLGQQRYERRCKLLLGNGISLFTRRPSGLMLAFGANRRIPDCFLDCAGLSGFLSKGRG